MNLEERVQKLQSLLEQREAMDVEIASMRADVTQEFTRLQALLGDVPAVARQVTRQPLSPDPIDETDAGNGVGAGSDHNASADSFTDELREIRERNMSKRRRA